MMFGIRIVVTSLNSPKSIPMKRNSIFNSDRYITNLFYFLLLFYKRWMGDGMMIISGERAKLKFVKEFYEGVLGDRSMG